MFTTDRDLKEIILQYQPTVKGQQRMFAFPGKVDLANEHTRKK